MGQRKAFITILLFLHIIATASDALRNCSWAIRNYELVTYCPVSLKETEHAAFIKDCETLSRKQNCSSPKDFKYHCVASEEEGVFFEVCASEKYINFGYCATFNKQTGQIEPHANSRCSNSTYPCPDRYASSKSYLYPFCYGIYEGTTVSPLKDCALSHTKEILILGSLGASFFLLWLVSTLRYIQKRRFKRTSGNQLKITKGSAHIAKTLQTPSKACRKEEFVPPDGGWGWVVCFTSCIANGTSFGILKTFGIFNVYLLKEYAFDDSLIIFPTDMIGYLAFVPCVFVRMWCDMFGIRQAAFIGAAVGMIGLFSSVFIQHLGFFYLTLFVTLGYSGGSTYFTSLVILGHYFKEHIGLANGIVTLGSSIYTVCFSIVLPIILESLSIKYTLIVFGGLYCTLLLCCLTWKPFFPGKIENRGLRLYKITHFLNISCFSKRYWKVFKNRTYFVWFLGFIVAMFGYFVPFVFIVRYSQDTFPDSNAFILITCLHITSGLGGVIFGKITDFKRVNRIYVQQCAFVLAAVLSACIPFLGSFEGLIVICLILGGCDGIIVCLIGPIAFDIVGPIDASSAISFLLSGFSILIAVGIILTNYLIGHLHKHKNAFVVAGFLPIVGAMIMCLISRFRLSSHASTQTCAFGSTSVFDIDHARPSTQVILQCEEISLCNIESQSSIDEEATTKFL